MHSPENEIRAEDKLTEITGYDLYNREISLHPLVTSIMPVIIP